MKARKSNILILISLLIVFMFLLFSCSCNIKEKEGFQKLKTEKSLGQADVVDETSDPNILQIAIGSKDHTTLVEAVKAAQIEHILVNAGPLTVFAPINAAFDALPEGTVEDLLKKENMSTLTTILIRHAAPGSFDVSKLKKEAKKGRKIYMATGDYLEITTKEEDVYINGCKILSSIQTSNGIINVIDKIILL
jgi:uncharacterized surface protein with fasciclin (FAS1) repeats